MMNTEPNFNSDRAHAGYSQEDKYFNEQERQKIEEYQRRQRELRDRQQAGAMQCPQCGADHRPTKLLGVDVTECAQCHGIFMNEQQVKAIQDLAAGQASS